MSTIAITDLTPRQREIMIAIAEGFDRAEVISNLEIRPKTYDSHRSAAMRRLGLRNHAEVTHLAITEGLVRSRDPRFYRPKHHGKLCGHGAPRADCHQCKNPPPLPPSEPRP